MKAILCVFLLICVSHCKLLKRKLADEGENVPFKIDEKNVKVVMIAELFRHGARWAKKDLFKKAEVAKNKARLTPVGMRQHYNLGRAVVTKYQHLFAKERDDDQMTMISSPVERTMESAQAHLMGMYPPPSGPKLTTRDPKFLKAPMDGPRPMEKSEYALPGGATISPVMVQPAATDRILMHKVQQICPIYKQAIKDAWKPHKKQADKDARQISDAVVAAGFDPTKMFGRTKHFKLGDISKMYDYFYAWQFQHGKLYPGVNAELFGKMKHAFALNYFKEWVNEDHARMWTQGVFRKVVSLFENRREKPDSALNYFGMSGHDSNIVPFLLRLEKATIDCAWERMKTLKEQKNCLPHVPFASNLIFELSTTASPGPDNSIDYLVRILYNGKPLFGCDDERSRKVLVKAPKYEGYCTLQEFKHFGEQEMTLDDDDYEKLCKGDVEDLMKKK